jgi:hypothetical protein
MDRDGHRKKSKLGKRAYEEDEEYDELEEEVKLEEGEEREERGEDREWGSGSTYMDDYGEGGYYGGNHADEPEPERKRGRLSPGTSVPDTAYHRLHEVPPLSALHPSPEQSVVARSC